MENWKTFNENSNNRDNIEKKNISIPVIEENLRIGTKLVETGKVNISKKVTREDFSVEVPVTSEEIVIEKKEINQFIQDVPPVTRQEGDTTIMSVFKEVLVVEKKIMLVEEIHITKKIIESTVTASDTLRKEEVIINRTSTGFYKE